MIVETDREDKTTKHNYYFINYSTFVNVIKVNRVLDGNGIIKYKIIDKLYYRV